MNEPFFYAAKAVPLHRRHQKADATKIRLIRSRASKGSRAVGAAYLREGLGEDEKKRQRCLQGVKARKERLDSSRS